MSDLILEIKEMIISGLFGEGLGLDSVDALELGLLIQKKYDIVINSKTENVKEIFANVVNLADFISKNRK